jgi:DNA-binding MarR family transcriptional regulator
LKIEKNSKKSEKEIISKSEMMVIKNAITNEMETAKVTVIVSKNKPKYKELFTIFFQAVNLEIVKRIKPITSKVLFYLCCKVNYDNFISIDQSEICETLHYGRTQIYLAIKELEDLGIIFITKHGNDGRCNVIHLHPLQSWKGEIGKRAEAIAKLNQTQLSLFSYDPEQKKLMPNETFDTIN